MPDAVTFAPKSQSPILLSWVTIAVVEKNLIVTLQPSVSYVAVLPFRSMIPSSSPLCTFSRLLGLTHSASK